MDIPQGVCFVIYVILTPIEMITIDDIRLVKTCNLSPEQYDAYIGDEKMGYIRLRWGLFEVRRKTWQPNEENENLYEHEFDFGNPTDPYGDFDTDEQRDYYLTRAKEALLNDYLNLQECQH